MNDLIMQHATMDVTYDCNLKCRLCGASAPYTPVHRRNFSFETQIDALKRFFQIVAHVKVFDLCGGEVLLYKNLKELLLCMKKYTSQFDDLRLVTNGTLLPGEELMDVIQTFGNKISFIVDNYGPELSKNAEELDMILTRLGIRHIYRQYTRENPYCGGWVDFGDFKKRKLESQEEAERLFSRCAIAQKVHFCFSILGAEVYPCQPARMCRELHIVDNYDEYLDLSDPALSVEEQRQKIKNICNVKYLSACYYCNGLCEDSKRYIPAEQLAPEEMEFVRAGAASYAEVLEMKEGRKQ